jgi:pimeloyl-ACP methyl ester carboxylesterase
VAEFVLLHGTTQSPSGWDHLVAQLAVQGHACDAVDLAGVDPSALAADYAEAVAAQTKAVALIVVAHSASGLLLPSVARRLGAACQVFLAA